MTLCLLFDTETASLNKPQGCSGVAEFGALDINLDTLEVNKEYHFLCNPGIPMEPGASEINGIYDKDVADKPLLEDQLNVVEPVILLAFNLPFDYKFTGHCFHNVQATFCALMAARQYIRNVPNHKLQTLIDHFGLDRGPPHTAVGDCYSTLNLLKLFVQETGRSMRDLIAAQQKPAMVHTMPFGMHRGKPIKDLPTNYITYFNGKEIDANLRKSFNVQLKLRGFNELVEPQ